MGSNAVISSERAEQFMGRKQDFRLSQGHFPNDRSERTAAGWESPLRGGESGTRVTSNLGCAHFDEHVVAGRDVQRRDVECCRPLETASPDLKTAPVGLEITRSAFAITPTVFENAPAGYANAPNGLAITRAGFAITPGGFANAPGGFANARSGFAITETSCTFSRKGLTRARGPPLLEAKPISTHSTDRMPQASMENK